MLKITSKKNSDSVRLTLEGSLTGSWTSKLEHTWQTIAPSGTVPFVADLTAVAFVGQDGKLLPSGCGERDLN